MIKPDYSQPIPADLGAVHFIGIGGSGMSGLAKLLLEAGHTVTGSDVRGSANVETLRTMGANIAIGHDAANLGAVDTVVVTSALWPTNPELLAARERAIPVLHRSALLAHLASSGRLVAVAGAHGKTTSTGMVITGLHHLGVSPSFVNGGVIHEFGASAAHGKDDLFIIEADESDSSFLHYKTAVALITNVDPDHLDHFGSLEAFEAEFRKFATAASDFVAISADDPGAVRVAEGLDHPRVIRFGFDAGADVRLSEVDASGPRVNFSLSYRGQTESAQLSIAGEHNAVNAAGAVAVLVGLGFDFVPALQAVSKFAGTQRRFEFHGSVGRISVFDDFAHHPTEVAAALRAARAAVGNGRIITVFQPHLFSRTRIFAAEFAAALELSDYAVVTDIYAAREDPEPGVTGALITDAALSAKLRYVPNWDDVPSTAAALAQPGDFIVTMGCGDIFRMVPELLAALER